MEVFLATASLGNPLFLICVAEKLACYPFHVTWLTHIILQIEQQTNHNCLHKNTHSPISPWYTSHQPHVNVKLFWYVLCQNIISPLHRQNPSFSSTTTNLVWIGTNLDCNGIVFKRGMLYVSYFGINNYHWVCSWICCSTSKQTLRIRCKLKSLIPGYLSYNVYDDLVDNLVSLLRRRTTQLSHFVLHFHARE